MTDWKKVFDDAVGQIGEAAEVAGQGLRRAASEAGKVVGVGVGNIELRADTRGYYRLGDVLSGTVTLRLEEPIEARRLFVALRATRKTPVVDVTRRGQQRSLQDELIHEFSCELSGPDVFQSKTYRFSLETPPELEMPVEVDGFLGDAMKAARAFKSMTERRLRWRLVATLEIPWKRNLSRTLDLDVREASAAPPPRAEPSKTQAPPKAEAPKAEASPKAEAAPKAEPTPKSEPPPKAEPVPKAEPPPPPEPITLPDGWIPALSRAMADLHNEGWVILHHQAGPPVTPLAVRDILAQHPDLDPNVLMFYGVMDGLEIIVGKPRTPQPTYETVQRIRKLADRNGGWVHDVGSLYVGEVQDEEFVTDSVRVLEIPTLARLFDQSEDFCHRNDRNVIFGAVTLYEGCYFGLTRADEIRSWRQTSAGQAARDGDYDHYAQAYQQQLIHREQSCAASWWVVRGEDHGGLVDPPQLLTWAEMLRACLHHLTGAE